MLFLDTSVFVKVYFRELGMEATVSRFSSPGEVLAASVLSYAEMHSVMARKYREKQISLAELSRLRETFERDWERLVNAVELNRQTLAALPGLVERYPLKSADAIQLSAALWLRDYVDVGRSSAEGRAFEFGVSDHILAASARKCGLVIFNPEEESQG